MPDMPDDLPDKSRTVQPRLQEERIALGFNEQKARDADAHKLRDAEMKRRREQQDAADAERQKILNRELQQIRQQADNRKGGWF